MRETRLAQSIIFDFYSAHEFSKQLQDVSAIIDKLPDILPLLSSDLQGANTTCVGRKALSVESTFRCLLLKQKLGVSYQQLSFHLSDSPTYRSFARLDSDQFPSKSALQANIRRIQPETLEAVFSYITQQGVGERMVDPSTIRIDSTVVKSLIAPPSDSQLLNDGVRVLSRYLAKSSSMTGTKIRFKDFRKTAKSLSYRIFYAKNAEKEVLYRALISVAEKVIGQADRGLAQVQEKETHAAGMLEWSSSLAHYRVLTARIVDQATRRVVHGEKVPASEKIVSLFEEHTDIIIKGARDIDYGHKINVASDLRGLLTSVQIEEGNPSDSDRYLPVIENHINLYGHAPETVVADGGYASMANVEKAKALSVRRPVFHKKRGLTLICDGGEGKNV